ncbi:hypothetical protein M0R45_018513 [Rubus argutus]|uniref:Thaumatin-like protein 1 n=1 Tax=Rubus argutus TaxID=59490 RepID=A0AAW1X3M7_RUBAR
MRSQVSLLSLLVVTVVISGAQSATFTFTNNCPFTVWPGTETGGGGAQLSTTGFELASGASLSVDVPAPWSGRFWGRTQCSADASGKFTCASGDCGSGQVACNGAGGIPPASLVELTLAANGGQDFYDPQYCCTGDHGTRETCPPTDYSMIFKSQCPQAYSYAYDDKSTSFTCNGGPNYLVTFCP